MNEITQTYSIGFGEKFKVRIDLLQVEKKKRRNNTLMKSGGEVMAEMEMPDTFPQSVEYQMDYKLTLSKGTESFNITLNKEEYSIFINGLSKLCNSELMY